MMEERFAVGSVVGTGAIINVKCGFKPRYIKIYNLTSATFETCEWWYGMTAYYGLKQKNSTFSQLTTNGLAQYVGADEQGGGQGFSIGADADLNVASEVIYWVAVR
jgi:hypothetical protein